jgi:NAD(P)H-dependent FMN reductase
MSHDIKLAIIYGSTRNGRFCDTVAGWVIDAIRARGGFDVVPVDPVEAHGDHETLRQQLSEAEAFVVVTPEYNHSFPGPLKSLIDAFNTEWQAKAVGFVSYGGISGGLRAVEHLRTVFAELHAVGIRDTVSFANAREHFDDNGALRDPGRAERSLERMLARLSWWASALRDARLAGAYEEATP